MGNPRSNWVPPLDASGRRLPRRFRGLTQGVIEAQGAHWTALTATRVSELETVKAQVASLERDYAAADSMTRDSLAPLLRAERRRLRARQQKFRQAESQRALWRWMTELKEMASQVADDRGRRQLDHLKTDSVGQLMAQVTARGPLRWPTVRECLEEQRKGTWRRSRRYALATIAASCGGGWLVWQLASRPSTLRDVRAGWHRAVSNLAPHAVDGRPRLTLVDPQGGDLGERLVVASGEAFEVVAEADVGATGVPPHKLTMLVDGALARPLSGLERTAPSPRRHRWRIPPMPPGQHWLRFMAESRIGRTERQLQLTVMPPRGRMSVLSIGISEYRQLPPTVCHFDAERVRRVLSVSPTARQGDRPRQVRSVPPAETITANDYLDRLEALKRSMTAADQAVVYLAGHAELQHQMLHFAFEADGQLEYLPAWKIAQWLARVEGKVLFMLDSCHSGSLIDSVRRHLEVPSGGAARRELSVGVLCSCRQDETAEFGGDGSLFARALTGVIENARRRSGAISISALIVDVTARVAAESSGGQNVVSYQRGVDFTLDLTKTLQPTRLRLERGRS